MRCRFREGVYVGEESVVRLGAIVRGLTIGENTAVDDNVCIGPCTTIGNDVVMVGVE